ncbi:MAG: sporulation initiation factor Spo0A C-terminal domain-containing protein [Clostridia bacterium]|nr:sporulation initiation factor Spo0A C-terminal domain-containing protein [Clostridia bacterium]
MDLQKSDRWITELLWEIGIPMHVNGYYYLLTAVQLVLTLSQPCINLSRQLYPSIAQRFQTSPSCVERSIRHAIDMAWKRGNLAAASGLFGRSLNLAYDKPTNSEMIALLAEKIRLRMYDEDNAS